ncbi:helix-turn-helix transcriptional regulator [Murimonas intestini]|uniref:helix-turn-helix transcriptional regulator n=1 Tax=Murimonas intestini TaxID=1337051 RepID=UPI00248B072B|nr:YafY family protein [Murimonas intestini]
MKIDRLIGILSILLQQEKVTAPYLAEKFEVSRRTINRDIEDICKAGIPLVTTQGTNGGIAIMEGYKLDRTVLTSSDMQSILAGLRSLDSVSGTNKYQQLIEKISAGQSNVLSSNSHIMIDLSSWYKSSLAPKIELIQDAIENRRLISFQYYAPGGESLRTIEPYLLIFQWTSWYVKGYCLEREGWRMFKLNRMLELSRCTESFEKRELPPYDPEQKNIFTLRYEVEALISPDMKWRLIEEFGADSFIEQEDGMLLFHFWFADKENLFGWIISFGEKAELIKPEELRDELADRFGRLAQKYGGTTQKK